MKDCDKDNIQHHVNDRGKAEAVKRMLRISRRLQSAGPHVVKDIKECSKKIDAQIERCVRDDGRGGVHSG